jgi:multidrug resistance efflux pump
MSNLIDTSNTVTRHRSLNIRPMDLRGRRSLQTATQLIQSTQSARRFAGWLAVSLMLVMIALLVLPWQQTSRGAGRVIAFSPMERPQAILAPTKGIIVDVPKGLVEGSRVKQGDPLLTIQPTAANMELQLERSGEDLAQKLAATEQLILVYEANIKGYEDARDYAVQAAEDSVSAAEAKLRGKVEEVVSYEAKVLQAQRNYERQNELYRQGIKPLKEIEKLEQELDSAKADLKAVKEAVNSAESELANKKAERNQKLSEAQTKVESARGIWQKVIGDAATIRKDIREMEMKQDTLSRMYVTAPRDGVVHRLPLVEGGQTVKEGDYLLTIVPDTTELAVEMTVVGNDLPLVRVGNHVRLQFEGWPSLQFSGWPGVAVGTFGGEVAVVDPTDDGSGVFRVLIKPDHDDQPWPDEKYLRQGLRANGWIMLGKVTVGFELWRQINGFPPSVDSSIGEKDGRISSGPKEKSKPPLPK